MEITENKFQTIYTSSDSQGKFEIRIHKDCSQIQLETDMDDGFGDLSFCDINKKELEAIRNMINTILGE